MVVLVTAVTAGAAVAQPSARVEYSFGLTSRQPGMPTGMTLRVFYGDPESKPPALEEVVLELPTGLRLDTGAVPRCEASNEELRLSGRQACPAASRIGAGSLTAVTGVPGADPFVGDVTVFNGAGELIELVTFRGTDSTAGYDRLKIDGDRLVAHPAPTPGGPPDGRTTVREIELAIDERGSLITTPPVCPPGGKWSSRARIKFASYEATTATAETPCVGSPAARQSPPMKLSVDPRVARRGARTRFRLRVSSSLPTCRRAVVVRLGGRRALTGRRGRAAVTAIFRRPGRRTARAAKPGCGTARARIRVR